MLINIYSVANLVFLDGLRRHALLGVIVLALVLEGGGLLFFEFFPRDIGRVSGDYILSVGWLAGMVFLLFHAVQALAWDEERRTIHTLLARPISRTQYVLGVFLGLLTILVLLNGFLAIIGYGILVLIKNSVDPSYFSHLSLYNYSISWFGLLTIELIILSVIMLFSGMVRGGFPVLLLSLCYYFTCSGLPVVRDAFSGKSAEQESFLTLVLTVLTAIFPNFSLFDFKHYITDYTSLNVFDSGYINFVVSFLYISLVLCLACAVYGRRDLK